MNRIKLIMLIIHIIVNISNNNLDAYDTIFAIENKNRNPKETIMYKDILCILLNNATQKIIKYN